VLINEAALALNMALGTSSPMNRITKVDTIVLPTNIAPSPKPNRLQIWVCNSSSNKIPNTTNDILSPIKQVPINCVGASRKPAMIFPDLLPCFFFNSKLRRLALTKPISYQSHSQRKNQLKLQKQQ